LEEQSSCSIKQVVFYFLAGPQLDTLSTSSDIGEKIVEYAIEMYFSVTPVSKNPSLLLKRRCGL